MELYYSFSVLIVLAAVFSFINERYLKLPSSIGIMLIAMVVSIGLVVFGSIFPDLFKNFTHLIAGVDFTEILMGAMLNFLLFAGAVHIRLEDLKDQRIPVIVFSTLSVVISTFVVGTLMFYILHFFHFSIPFLHCLLFGALISPTDPIAVLAILKQANVPKSLQTKVAGESLFNDGMAVVVFLLILQLVRGEDVDLSFGNIVYLFIKEAIGGFVLGLIIGYIASNAMHKVDEAHNVTVLITLAVVMGGYLVAQSQHISGPLTMVAAGLVVGNFGNSHKMSSASRDYLGKFWELIDEILNAILFLFIGFELLLIPDLLDYTSIGLIAITVVLFARFISIWVPIKVIPFKEKFTRKTIVILVWGGLRGGVSIALALSVDQAFNKVVIVDDLSGGCIFDFGAGLNGG